MHQACSKSLGDSKSKASIWDANADVCNAVTHSASRFGALKGSLRSKCPPTTYSTWKLWDGTNKCPGEIFGHIRSRLRCFRD